MMMNMMTGAVAINGGVGVMEVRQPQMVEKAVQDPKAENFGADNLVYHHFNRLDIEVYTDYKDPDMEANIEEVLTAHELYYEKSEVWIETEKMYEVLYELTV